MNEHIYSKPLSPNEITLDRLSKLLRRTKKEEDCWIFMQNRLYSRARINGKEYSVHRITKTAATGKPIPRGMVVDHTCSNKLCVNPNHLEVVTYSDNTKRAASWLKRKPKTHCPYGHPYQDDNLYFYRGGKVCNECRRRRGREWYQRNKFIKEVL